MRNGWLYLLDENDYHPCGTDWSLPFNYKSERKKMEMAEEVFASRHYSKVKSIYYITESEFKSDLEPPKIGKLIMRR